MSAAVKKRQPAKAARLRKEAKAVIVVNPNRNVPAPQARARLTEILEGVASLMGEFNDLCAHNDWLNPGDNVTEAAFACREEIGDRYENDWTVGRVEDMPKAPPGHWWKEEA
ncbi:MAG TPA: hypothetical protein VK550_13535 [Polyangiaceae bacterium]|nr:hypothetical protein [Polyangiaceae bacterium]